MPEDHRRHASLPDQGEPARPKLVRAKHAASLIVLRMVPLGVDARPDHATGSATAPESSAPATSAAAHVEAAADQGAGGFEARVGPGDVDAALFAAGEPHMLMGMRGAKHRFMPNRLVFPGGRVEAADLQAASAAPLAPHTERLLRKHSNARLARALGIAAARELLEETGLSLGLPPRLDRLHYLARAVTPPSSPIRFNARFFVVAAADVSGCLGGDGELDGLRFYSMTEALALDLALPTRRVLERLQCWLALTKAERMAQTHTPVLLRDRGWRME